MSDKAKTTVDQVIGAHSPLVLRLFMAYCDRMVGRKFTAMRLLGAVPEAIPEGRSAIFFCNHSSWYDPLICLMLSTRFFPQLTPFGPMDAAALERYAFMRKVGLFGVEQDSPRGAVHFLRISRGLLAHGGNCIWLTPQGEFADARTRPVVFQPGIAHLARNGEAIAIPVAFEFLFWNESRPEILIRFGEPIDTAARHHDVQEWTTVLQDALAETQDELAAAAMAREPAPFTTLIDGTKGVNPIYDGWRYLKALVRRERFSASHGDIGKER
jgi:1-acyl-sn-glycerol-3-phosphate acyltransferase